ncbi:MAG TPA: PfkB family carbohydrate kinase, partial [Planctomycetota bacterium]|nr:PfkB family carbohydrate kinase [Planctomycetota bacterium]
GMDGVIASRIGDDDLGRRLHTDVLPARGMTTDFLQTDATHPTGTVNVHLDAGGNATYEIVEDVAWDYLEMTSELEALAHRTDGVSFGTLAQRTESARAAIDAFVEIARDEHAMILLDVNLRQSFYTADLLRRCCLQADVLKMNEAELIIARTMLGAERLTDEEFLLDLINTYHMEIVCLTRGSDGCVMHTAHDRIVSPGFSVKVQDTVGAGDAFSAGLLVKFLEGAGLREMARYANLCGAYVASQHGGTPPISREIIDEFGKQYR